MTATEPLATDSPADDTSAGDHPSGRIVAIAGPVVDVEFPSGAIPEINTALEFDLTIGGDTEVVTVVAEVAQQLSLIHI